MRMDARHKMSGTAEDGSKRIERTVLGEAVEGYLPPDILWRQKEQFSDGVGRGIFSNGGSFRTRRSRGAQRCARGGLASA